MPIRKELKKFYGADWQKRARALKASVGWRCETCGIRHGHLEPREDGSFYRVVLTVAHLNHDPQDNRRANLRVLCPRCHLAHDKDFHAANAAQTRIRKTEDGHKRAGQLNLFRVCP